MTDRPGGRPLVPAYLSTGGVARPSRPQLERLSVLTGTGTAAPTGLPAAQLALLDALDGGSLTVVEAAALLRLPVSAVRVWRPNSSTGTWRWPVPRSRPPDASTPTC